MESTYGQLYNTLSIILEEISYDRTISGSLETIARLDNTKRGSPYLGVNGDITIGFREIGFIFGYHNLDLDTLILVPMKGKPDLSNLARSLTQELVRYFPGQNIMHRYVSYNRSTGISNYAWGASLAEILGIFRTSA